MFGRKLGAEVSVLQELCHFVIFTINVCIMTDSTYFVKSAPLRAFTGSFQHLQICYRDIEDVHKEG